MQSRQLISKQQQSILRIMDRTISQADNTIVNVNARTMAVSSRQKFENVGKLNTLVKQVQQNNARSAQPDEILGLIKNKIKNNYNTLYENYNVNKGVIKKAIQQTENNNAGENAMNAKLQNVIKDKNAYDKLKAEVDQKQRRLKKLMDLRDQLKSNGHENQYLREVLADRTIIIRYLEEHREVLDYETAILKKMSKDRTNIKLNLKEKHDHMMKEDNVKKQRIAKVQDAAHTKKILLKRIQQKIAKEEQCQIPLSLAEELEKKLEEYQGKFSHENIIAHETQINQEKAEEERELLEQEQRILAKIKEAKEREEKKEFDMNYNILLLKETEEEKIKKLCGVGSLKEIANDTLQMERGNLEIISENIQRQIDEILAKNEEIKKDIETITTTLENQQHGNMLLKVEKKLETEEAETRKLKIQNKKKEKNLTQWQAIAQMITEGTCDRSSMVEKLQEKIGKYEQLSNRQKLEESIDKKRGGINRSSNKKFKKLNLKSENNTESQVDEFDL